MVKSSYLVELNEEFRCRRLATVAYSSLITGLSLRVPQRDDAGTKAYDTSEEIRLHRAGRVVHAAYSQGLVYVE